MTGIAKCSVVTAFGDWFLLDDDGSVHFLDLVAVKLSKAAETGAEFKQVMGRPEKRDEWFMTDLVQALLDAGIVLGPGQCYSYKLPAVVGGQLEVANIEPTDRGGTGTQGPAPRQTANMIRIGRGFISDSSAGTRTRETGVGRR